MFYCTWYFLIYGRYDKTQKRKLAISSVWSNERIALPAYVPKKAEMSVFRWNHGGYHSYPSTNNVYVASTLIH